jgi:hypothetical protein
MGYESYFVTQKASYEDVVIKIDGQVIVSDTKSFRLSRSQAAPNVKDFVKPEDYRKWINRHTGNKLGGLVVFPQLHEWSKGSDAHTYCSDKDNPILMLPFHYLAYLLSARNRLGFNASDVCQLWDYNRLFPSKVKDRIVYWKVINHAILSITNDTPDEMIKFLEKSEQRMYRYVVETLTEINGIKVAIKDRIIAELREMGVEEIKELFMRYRIQTETDGLNTLLQRIADFRLENQHTKYRSFIRKSF